MNAKDEKFEEVLSRIRRDEGFRAKPYIDPRGKWTIGYGTNIADGITMDEADMLLRERLARGWEKFERSWQPAHRMPGHVREALMNMVYQLGPSGVLEFKKMLVWLERGVYIMAHREALDSKWARETPRRAKRVADMFITP